jgi:tRNA(Met) cytidine acetyltransferase
LEAFTFAALGLDATAAPDEAVAQAHLAGCVAERLDRDALAADEDRLRALFGLLVAAHYRTTPGDLYRLLDGPNLSADVLWWGEHIVAAALVGTEGGLSAELCAAVYEGRRRPQGHMIPETLCMHAGVDWAPRLKGARVVRIAVHPGVRSRGLGGALLAHVVAQAEADGLDWVGSGFGATGRLLRFWDRAGLSPVRMGVTRGRSTGAWSAVVLKPLSEAGRTLHGLLQARMRDELPHALNDSLSEASVNLALSLVRATGTTLRPSAEDREACAAVAFGPRISDVATAAVWRCVWRGLAENLAPLDPLDRAVLVRRVIQRWPWEALISELGLTGRVAAQKRLRAGLAALLVPQCFVDEIEQFQRFASEARLVLPSQTED